MAKQTYDPLKVPLENQIIENKTRQSALKLHQEKETVDSHSGSFNMLNPVITDVPQKKKEYLEEITSFWVSGRTYFFTDGESTVAIEIVSDKIIRVRLAPQGTFLDDFSYAIHNKEFKISKIEFTENKDNYYISTGTVTCRIHKRDFLISFLDCNENVLNEDIRGMHWEENLDFGGYYVYTSKRFQPNECFYGLGDKPTHLNLKGKRFALWGSDTYAFEYGRDPFIRIYLFM